MNKTQTSGKYTTAIEETAEFTLIYTITTLPIKSKTLINSISIFLLVYSYIIVYLTVMVARF